MDTGRASAEYAPVAPPVHSEAELELQTTRGQSSQLESCTVAPLYACCYCHHQPPSTTEEEQKSAAYSIQ